MRTLRSRQQCRLRALRARASRSGLLNNKRVYPGVCSRNRNRSSTVVTAASRESKGAGRSDLLIENSLESWRLLQPFPSPQRLKFNYDISVSYERTKRDLSESARELTRLLTTAETFLVDFQKYAF